LHLSVFPQIVDQTRPAGNYVVTIPDRFTLIDGHANTKRAVKVMWRKNDLMGVQFE
jgi:hypothetical protein